MSPCWQHPPSRAALPCPALLQLHHLALCIAMHRSTQPRLPAPILTFSTLHVLHTTPLARDVQAQKITLLARGMQPHQKPGHRWSTHCTSLLRGVQALHGWKQGHEGDPSSPVCCICASGRVSRKGVGRCRRRHSLAQRGVHTAGRSAQGISAGLPHHRERSEEFGGLLAK